MKRKMILSILWAVSGIAVLATDGLVLADYPGEVVRHGWRMRVSEAGKVVYIPFEGYYESKGGRIESERFDLKGARFARLTFSARAKSDGFWWIDLYAADGKRLADVNSRIYTSEDWRDYEEMVPIAASAAKGLIAFVSETGVDVRDVRFEAVTVEDAAGWCDRLYATLPQVQVGDCSHDWEKLPRAAGLIRSGRSLKVVLLGDSIVNDTYCGNVTALVQRRFPNVDFVLSVRGSTGCWYYRDPKHFEEYVLAHKPDLVLVGGISNGKDDADFSTAEDDLVAVIELAKNAGVEIAVMSPPPSYEWRESPEDTAWDENFVHARYEAWAKKVMHWQPLRRDYQRAATAKTGVAYWDMTTAPCEAISKSGKPLNWFHRDLCHNDDRGKQLIARTFAAHFEALMSGAAWPVRAIQLDLARQMETVEFVKRYLAFAKESEYNTVQLYLEGRIRTRSFPFRLESETYSPDEMREIVREARRLGLDLVPVVSVLGHAENFVSCPELDDLCEESRAGRGRMCKNAPKRVFCHSVPRTREFLEKYLAEIMEIFPGKNFHVGLDESFDTGFCPDCARQMKTIGLGGIYLDVINWVHGFLAKNGRRMWMWDDFFEFFPEKADEVPRDIMMCDWEYSRDISRNRGHYGCFGDRFRGDWVRRFRTLGIDTVVCPSWDKLPMTRYCDWSESAGGIGGVFVQWEMSQSFHARNIVLARATGLRWESGLAALSYDEALRRSVESLYPSLSDTERKAVFSLVTSPCDASSDLAVSLLGKRVPEIVDADPFSESAMLDDLVTSARLDLIKTVLSDAEYAISGVYRRPEMIRSVQYRVAGLETSLMCLRDRRQAQERAWRAGCAPNELTVPVERQLSRMKAIMSADVSAASGDEWQIEMSFLLPDFHGKPCWLVEGCFNGQWKELALGRWKPEAGEWCYFERTVSFRDSRVPDRLRVTYCGYNDAGLAFIALANNRYGRLVPDRLLSVSGRVRDAENVLEDTVDAAFLGNPNCRAAMLNPALADEVSTLEVSLKREFR